MSEEELEKQRKMLLDLPKETLVDLVLAGDKIENNWNKLKKWLLETYYLYIPEIYNNSTIVKLLNKMQELEGENNENTNS